MDKNVKKGAVVGGNDLEFEGFYARNEEDCSDDDEGEDELGYDDIDVISEDDELLEVWRNLGTHNLTKGENFEVDVFEVDENYDSDRSTRSIYSDEDEGSKMIQWPGKTYDKDCDHKTLKFELGMTFKDSSECKAAIKLWAIFHGHNLIWSRTGKNKLQATCEGECKFQIYASRMNPRDPTCIIKTLIDDDGCQFATKNRQASSGWLAEMFEEKIKKFGKYTAADIKNDAWQIYGIDVNIRSCYRAQWAVVDRIKGTLSSHYANLQPYLLELKKRDREGRFELQTYLNEDENPVFYRVYIGFSALRKDFVLGCRRLLGFDACFLKTVVGGALLCAVAKDCNFRMFPVAWAVVQAENEENWTWFFEKLFADLGITCGLGWTFMSDKQKGLINGIHKLAPNAEHRNCARHVYMNWKKKWGGDKFKDHFWAIAHSTNKSQFTYALNQLKATSEQACQDFLDRKPRAFCKSLFQTTAKSDMANNNICETFNSYIVKSRDKPLIHVLEDIRSNLMTRMCNFAADIETHKDVICPEVRKRLEKELRRCRFCEVKGSTAEKYEVHVSDDVFIVDLIAKECSCNAWQMSGLPCYHVLACLQRRRLKYEDYVDDFYKKSNWKATYQYGLEPIEGQKNWPRENCMLVLPPNFKKGPGRPKKNRKKDALELKKKSINKLAKVGSSMTCGKCGGVGHNMRTCKTPTSTTGSSAPSSGMSEKKKSTARKPSMKRKPSATERENKMTRREFGVRVTESGRTFYKAPGGKQVQYIGGPSARGAGNHAEEGGSQSSQVINCNEA